MNENNTFGVDMNGMDSNANTDNVKLAPLNDRQERFCYEYVLHLNATKAAINAGYSEKTACVIGSENLRKPYIKNRIKYMQDNLAETAQLSALRVLKEHEKIAFNDEEKTADRQKSLDSINNMLGYNAPTKSEVLSNMTISTPKTLDDWYNQNRGNYNSDKADD